MFNKYFANQTRSNRLNLIVILSVIIAVLMLISSISGIIFRESVYISEELLNTFVSNDAANLFIGMPILIGSIISIRKGSLTGMLCLPGALLYCLYNYIVYSLCMPFNIFYLNFPLLVILSLTTLVICLRMLSGNDHRSRLEGKVHEKLTGGLLIGMGGLFFFRAAGIILSSFAQQTALLTTELAVNIADLIITPLWVIIGILLWRHHRLGYSLGLAVLFQANSLFWGLILFMLLQPLLTSTLLATTDLMVISVMAVFAITPLLLFLHGISKSQKQIL